jgi:hypothetical protein
MPNSGAKRLKHVQCVMSLTINYRSAVTTSGRGKIYHYLITIMHHNGTISRRSKMFYSICKSLSKSICTTSENMKHHFMYGLGWDHKQKFSKCRSIKFGFQCAFKCSSFIVLSSLLCLWYLSLFYILATGTHRTHIIPPIISHTKHPRTHLRIFFPQLKMLCVPLVMAA